MKKKYILIEIIFLFIMIIFSINYQHSKNDSISLDENQETILSLTIDGVVSETFPSKESGKTIESIECDNDAVGSWDYESWGPMIRNVSKNRTKCQFNFVTKYHESILNGTDPVLKDGLIPVTIDDDGTVRKAYLGREWYDYETRRWANAVVLEDESKKYYEGDIIPEDNIESYFVWIPKYRYKLWDLGNYTGLTSIQNKVQTIDVIFGDYNTKDSISGECTTPGVSGASSNCKVGDYMTHPAFLSFGTKGLWVGKFETGYKGAAKPAGAQQNINDPSKVEIKPNVYSWRKIQVAYMHLNSYNYKREYDSHMMKNTEWGSVAYLQHSKYGSRKSVRINNNSNYITGYSSTKEPTCGYTRDNRDCNRQEGTALNADGTYTKRYNTDIGYLASTTKNITGIYDMSGGAWEYMMSAMKDSNGKIISGRNSLYNSGFNGMMGCPTCDEDKSGLTIMTNGIDMPKSKYYDTYRYSENDTYYNRRILGDATGEMGPFASISYGSDVQKISSWYTDTIFGFFPSGLWSVRSSDYGHGLNSGIFAAGSDSGHALNWITYRIVLAI